MVRFYLNEQMLEYNIMISWFIKCIIISLSLITLLHYLYTFLIDTLTVPKLRDFVNKPAERYNEILSAGVKQKVVPTNDEMQNELRDFLSNIKKEPHNESL